MFAKITSSLLSRYANSKSRIHDQQNLLSQSCFEIGLINYEVLADYKTAKKWIKKAKSDYSGVSQVLVEYRVRWVLDNIKAKKKEERALAKQQAAAEKASA